jgi:hypothetical protein
VREALIVVWEASDRICGKRLRPLLPILVEAMERHGHLQLVPEVRARLLAMSAATIDRALRDIRRQAGTATRRLSAPSAAIRRSVPVRTFDDWNDPPPRFVEADLVAHSGPVTRGSFVQTLVLTDIATGWTECAPLLVREQRLLTEVLGELRKLQPFPLLGLDTDNDSVFMNETVRDYCQQVGIEFTRCRPYRKNDQAWVEQKRAPDDWPWALRGPGSRGGAGTIVCRDAAVREFLPTLLQAGLQGARWGTGQEALSPPSDTLSTVDSGPTDERGGAPPSARAAVHVGPSSPAEGDSCGPAAAR